MTHYKRSHYLFISLTIALLTSLLLISQATKVTFALTPTVTPSRTPTVTPSATPPIICNQIAVAVDPVTSPTSLFTQTITAQATGGGLYQFTITVTDPNGNPNGTYTPTSGPSTVSVPITLQASTTHNLTVFVSGEVMCHQGDLIFFVFDSDSTNIDINGRPLTIVQQGGVSPTPTETNTPTITLTPTETNTATNTPTNTPAPPRSDTIGVYQDGLWYLRNTNDAGAADITVPFGGDPSDLPIVGDWNGDGVDTIGVYRNSTGFFFLSDSNTSPAVNYTVLFGNPGDMPFAGRWTNDMTGSGIGVYRNSNGILYQRKSLTSGFDDFFAIYGNPGDVGVAGDWDGDGFDSIGIYRSNQTWYLTNNSTPSGITFSNINFVWTAGSARPVVGDWNGDGITTVGYRSSDGFFTLHSANAVAGTDNTFVFGPTGFTGYPVAGKWIAGSQPAPINAVIGVRPPAGAPNAGDSNNTD